MEGLEVKAVSPGRVAVSHPTLKTELILGSEINRSWQIAASKLGISVFQLKPHVDQALQERKDKEIEEELQVQTMKIWVRRPAIEKRSQGEVHEGPPNEVIESALHSSKVIPDYCLLEWKKTELLSCLRVTFRKDPAGAPKSVHFATLVNRLGPTPFCGWQTHRGDVELLYKPHSHFTAKELASMAALSATEIWPLAQVDVVTVVTHPKSVREYEDKVQKCTPIETFTQSVEGALSHWRGYEASDASDGDVAFWLEQRSLEIGKRYEHELCPFDPGPSSSGASQGPVIVNQDGVSCYRCRRSEEHTSELQSP